MSTVIIPATKFVFRLTVKSFGVSWHYTAQMKYIKRDSDNHLCWATQADQIMDLISATNSGTFFLHAARNFFARKKLLRTPSWCRWKLCPCGNYQNRRRQFSFWCSGSWLTTLSKGKTNGLRATRFDDSLSSWSCDAHSVEAKILRSHLQIICPHFGGYGRFCCLLLCSTSFCCSFSCLFVSLLYAAPPGRSNHFLCMHWFDNQQTTVRQIWFSVWLCCICPSPLVSVDYWLMQACLPHSVKLVVFCASFSGNFCACASRCWKASARARAICPSHIIRSKRS